MSTTAQDSDAAQDVARALGALDIGAHPESIERAADLRLDIGEGVLVQVKRLSVPTGIDHVLRAVTSVGEPSSPGVVMIVADRVPEALRAELRHLGVGFLDLRGHLFLTAAGVRLDVDVQPMLAPAADRDVWAGQVSLEVATALLLEPRRPSGVRALARRLGRSPGTVSQVLSRFRDSGLVAADNAPDIPELFWQAATAWAPQVFPVGTLPPKTGAAATALQTAFDEPETTGWALTDVAAASAYGAPIGARADQVRDFLVPPNLVRRAVQLLGAVPPGGVPLATLRAAPSPLALQHRVQQAGSWPLAPPLFVALDLALDQGRGREVLEQWQPPPPWVRVW